jgi:DNA-binding CsgD family transcriptional regulator
MRRNQRLKDHILAWAEILDALGWCVALKSQACAPHLSHNALTSYATTLANPAGTWDELMAYLDSASLASRPVNAETIQVWASPLPRESPASHADRLTPRETEVLAWLREGKTGPEIAIIVGCAQRTVESHVARLYRKLGCRNRTAVLLSSFPHG